MVPTQISELRASCTLTKGNLHAQGVQAKVLVQANLGALLRHGIDRGRGKRDGIHNLRVDLLSSRPARRLRHTSRLATRDCSGHRNRHARPLFEYSQILEQPPLVLAVPGTFVDCERRHGFAGFELERELSAGGEPSNQPQPVGASGHRGPPRQQYPVESLLLATDGEQHEWIRDERDPDAQII